MRLCDTRLGSVPIEVIRPEHHCVIHLVAIPGRGRVLFTMVLQVMHLLLVSVLSLQVLYVSIVLVRILLGVVVFN